MTSRRVSITVVLPVFNESDEIGETMAALAREAALAPELALDLIVVDDGSTDATGEAVAVASKNLAIPVSTHRQRNAGRFAARRAGLAAATGEYVMFLDSRVQIKAGSLRFVVGELQAGNRVWNAHVHIITKGNPFGHFWNCLTEVAFSHYFDDPRRASFTAANFDAFPKGTTCFLAPTDVVRAAYRQVRSYYGNDRYANDDTPMIRWIAGTTPVNIAPDFACAYQPRRTLRGFVRHAFHRGIVFLDGHGRPGARLLPATIAFYPISACALALLLSRRRIVVVAAGICIPLAAALVAKRHRRPAIEVTSFALLSPVYAAAHGAGMWWGLLLVARKWMDRAR